MDERLMTEQEEKSRRVVDIRKATLADNVKIYRVLKDAFSETSLAFPPLDEDASISWICQVLNTGLVYVAEYSGRIIGSIGMEASYFPWANRENGAYANNVWLYVHPKYRSTGAADAMVKKVLEFMNAAGMLAVFGVMMEHNVELKERFLKMKGMDYIGASFLYQRHILSNQTGNPDGKS